MGGEHGAVCSVAPPTVCLGPENKALWTRRNRSSTAYQEKKKKKEEPCFIREREETPRLTVLGHPESKRAVKRKRTGCHLQCSTPDGLPGSLDFVDQARPILSLPKPKKMTAEPKPCSREWVLAVFEKIERDLLGPQLALATPEPVASTSSTFVKPLQPEKNVSEGLVAALVENIQREIRGPQRAVLTCSSCKQRGHLKSLCPYKDLLPELALSESEYESDSSGEGSPSTPLSSSASSEPGQAFSDSEYESDFSGEESPPTLSVSSEPDEDWETVSEDTRSGIGDFEHF